MNTLLLLRWTSEVMALTLLSSLPSCSRLGSRPTTPLLLHHHLLLLLIFLFSSPSSSLSRDGGESNVVPTRSALTWPPTPQMQPRDPCDVVNNGPPFCCSPLYSRESSCGQDHQCWICVFWPAFFYFAVAHSTTQSISSHWKHQRNT